MAFLLAWNFHALVGARRKRRKRRKEAAEEEKEEEERRRNGFCLRRKIEAN